MALFRLPHDLIQLILCFVEAVDKVECISCCRDWYFSLMRTIRYLHLKKGSHSVTNLSQLISSPWNQLSVETGDVSINDVACWLSNANYRVNKLVCSGFDIVKILQHTESLHVKSLTVRNNGDGNESGDEGGDDEEGSENQTFDRVSSACLCKVLDCESLCLGTPSDKNVFNTTAIPYFASVKRLEISNGNLSMNLPFLQQYSKTLHSLTLFECDVTDVSMLGHIPHLELSCCNNVVDITSLNYNDSVRVHGCAGITEYSFSFAFSRKIDISIFICRQSCNFNLERWTKVEELQLKFVPMTMFSLLIGHDCTLPRTVKKCSLSHNFVSEINFRVTSNHSLHELKLSGVCSITSLEGYGLERVAIIELEILPSLQSLEGLGRGRNRKVIINGCNEITDFSPLNHVPIVEITQCPGFTNPLQLRDVQSLSVLPLTNISFNSEQYVNIHSLTLLYSRDMLTEFDGLEHIPYLHLDQGGLRVLLSFLEKGRKVYNQRIEFTVFGIYSSTFSLTNRFLSSHDRFLQKDYDYFDKLPKRWIWRRKEISE